MQLFGCKLPLKTKKEAYRILLSQKREVAESVHIPIHPYSLKLHHLYLFLLVPPIKDAWADPSIEWRRRRRRRDETRHNIEKWDVCTVVILMTTVISAEQQCFLSMSTVSCSEAQAEWLLHHVCLFFLKEKNMIQWQAQHKTQLNRWFFMLFLK